MEIVVVASKAVYWAASMVALTVHAVADERADSRDIQWAASMVFEVVAWMAGGWEFLMAV